MARSPYALLLAGILISATTAVSAAPVYNFQMQMGVPDPAPAANPQPTEPFEIVAFGVGELHRFLGTDAAQDSMAIEHFLEESIAPYFDFAAMGRWAAGPFYRRLDEAQREAFHANLQRLFLSSLARNLGGYAQTAPRVQIYPPASDRWGDEMTVRTRITPHEGYPIAVNFRLYRRGDEWKVFDVAANGFSAVTFYRGHFAALVRRHGPRALYQ